MEKQKFYLTTAITYTSGKPHIGNTYEIVLADLIARAKRMQGYDVHFQTGTDEHGEKIELKAKYAGVSPQKFVDDVAGEIKRIWDLMDTTYDRFMRTTDKEHERQVQKLFEKLYEQGDIYKGSYKGHYCTPCESFWTASQLVDGKCPDCGREVHEAEEEAYFFAMSKYSDKLMQYYNEHPEFITPISRKNEMVNNFLKPGLQDLCVSRTSFSWGIPVSFDKKHVVYVWLDALTNYITGVGYDCGGEGSEQFKKQWPADLHIIGKDIVRFHVIYWPIFLMALGLPLPKQIYGHPWLLQDGGKMSKSKGNVIYADDLVDVFGVDAVRYYLLGQMPFDNDGTISWESVIDVINSELVNVYGNLVQRTVAMSNKYFDGNVCNTNVCEQPYDDELKAMVTGLKKRVFDNLDGFRVADALGEILTVLRRANKYIDETMPWVLAKDESKQARLQTVLYNLTETIVICSSMLVPFIPKSAKLAIEQCGATEREYQDLDKFGLLGNVKVSSNPVHLFARLDADKIMSQLKAKGLVADDDAKSEQKQKKAEDKKENKKVENVENVVTINEICIDDFAKVQLRVGQIMTAEKVEKADKLLKFTVKIGEEVRTIVSGIAKFYTPEEMVGKNVVVVYNLKPAKLRGIESQGMLLCACEQTEDGERVVLVSPEKPVTSGSVVR